MLVIDCRSKAKFQEKKGLTNLHTSKNVKNFGHVAFRIEVFFVLRPEFCPDSFQDKLLSKLMQNINYFHLALKLQLLVWPQENTFFASHS